MDSWIVKCNRRLFIAVLTFFLLTGCSLLGVSSTSKATISEYAEALFMHQNKLTQEVMMIPENEIILSEANEKALFQMELEMHDACRLLNEYANREIEGKKMGVLFKRRVQKSFATCAKRVENLQRMLFKILPSED